MGFVLGRSFWREAAVRKGMKEYPDVWLVYDSSMAVVWLLYDSSMAGKCPSSTRTSSRRAVQVDGIVTEQA